MTKKVKIVLMVSSLIVALYFIRRACYQPILNCRLIDGGFIDTFEDLTIKNQVVFETSESVTGIVIFFDGEIHGNGILTVASNNSTSYREYYLDSGIVDLAHKSDWYSTSCYISFIPKTETTGKISFNLRFIGN